ncbi:trypsin-like serine protease [Kibdelosporangium phytohabitans]|uniref:Trypsin n=1 Tax=Kibdelosporangium phytohabitans TaxID=860235 RepID=A0A0N7F3E4_9PSEU|nr:trypsin-like serine protease [Kibdelosporangium phytohabitans]ALG08399.1 trypsin [Kibdelosporangium phytohabitans]MBE1470552.1 secreted trypsin-like serine protease [Kibdelosporangium phytohabitans]
MSRRARTAIFALPLLITALISAASTANAVIDGSVSRYGPWAVRMLVDGQPLCTGTAVSPEWIISASHCFFDLPEAPVADSRIEFRVGSLDMRTGTPVHPVPGSRVRNPDGLDVLLIKVPRMNIPVARLSSSAVQPGQRVRVLGWGATCDGDENNCQSNVLKQADLRVQSTQPGGCDEYGTPDGANFCAVRLSGGPAGGDSGGPVVTSAPRGKETLVGVFWGADRSRLVGASAISHQLGWIRSVIGK